MSISRFDTVKNIVEAVLTAYPETRNSDILLIIRIWAREMEQAVMIQNFKKLSVFKLKDCKILTAPATIMRMRRVIQNEEERLLPTEEKVMRNRIKNTEKLKEWLLKLKTEREVI